jgi:hypothetical protein
MQIGSTSSPSPYSQNALGLGDKDIKTLKEKIHNGEISGKTLSQAYLVEYSLKIESFSSGNLQAQSAPFDLEKVRDILSTIDFESIGYSGKPIADMSPEEAQELVSEEGFFGISQTSDRLADFVISGGGDDIERLKAGREGIIQGFTEAEKIWGEKLPDISYQTLEKALEKIDQRIEDLGANVIDMRA